MSRALPEKNPAPLRSAPPAHYPCRQNQVIFPNFTLNKGTVRRRYSVKRSHPLKLISSWDGRVPLMDIVPDDFFLTFRNFTDLQSTNVMARTSTKILSASVNGHFNERLSGHST